jgi:type I restriction enzyme, R subunit
LQCVLTERSSKEILPIKAGRGSKQVTNEAFARVKIDQLLKDAEWKLTDGRSVRFEYLLEDGGKADYALFDRLGRALAVLEAKSTSVNLSAGEVQGQRYADQLDVPFIFLSNGEEIWFRDKTQYAHYRRVETVFSQDDLARRKAAWAIRRNPLDIPIDLRIAGGGGRLHQTACIEKLCQEIVFGRRKMLVEMATGTGKTRTAAALLKRLFDSNWTTRALFVVDRNTLAIQAEDAFAEHLPHLPCYRVPRTGRRFQDEKRVTIVTLQTLVNEYEKYSSGYFDLIVVDECHRSIYGKWRRALDHFDGIKVGPTATPCVMRDAPDVDEEDRATIRDTMRFFEVDRPTYSYTMSEAIADGHLVPYEIYRAMTARTAATEGFSVSRGEIDWESLDEPTRAELEGLFAERDPIVVDPTALERKFTIPERNRAVVREFRDVLESGYTGPNGVRQAPDWGKTIVFAVNKRHAETLARLFDDVFADKKPSPTTRYADFVVSGLGPDDSVDGQAKIQRFKKEEFPQILVSVNMLDTGFDCPEVRNLVMARFTHSLTLSADARTRDPPFTWQGPIHYVGLYRSHAPSW